MRFKERGHQSRRQFLRAAAVTAAALTVGNLPLKAQTGRTPRPIKIGIIGSGLQGGAIGVQWAKAGHDVLFSSRHPEQLKDLVASAGSTSHAGLPQEAAAFGDVILIAVPYGALPQVGRDFEAALKGKVVIECGNPRAVRDGPMADAAMAKGTGLASAEYLPGTRLVRAFNAIGAALIPKEAHRAGELLGIPIAGDDQAAVATVARLVEDAGFEPVIVGGLARAKEFDRGSRVTGRGGLTARQIREALNLPPKS